MGGKLELRDEAGNDKGGGARPVVTIGTGGTPGAPGEAPEDPLGTTKSGFAPVPVPAAGSGVWGSGCVV